ncbi:hypothetical protein K437DRAFT_255825 [Tilletiaria anomala UBC 951]|uniref:UreD-domain-containing protein n=1 Tax=Tilletiaria anomala (strain ATCC 24038 / CBS 436.72 / UBC 951) TaxID=1037660 RepID=A0A066W0Q0_TILAU|nr:uncharacterized protein K437DRAFT_255825 [Tilletiaria anomala UBC 951]KDN47547.1 hypothetical protein K437DRAFT_255825 [Tilletiaria anomala UBC 951]
MSTQQPGSFRAQSFQATGKATLRSFGGSGSRQYSAVSASSSTRWCTFSELAFTFPLKLISPRQSSEDAVKRIWEYRQRQAKGKRREPDDALIKPVGVLYIVGYGGGLVSGDVVKLDIDVGSGSTLLALTQGSTKVFKVRRRLPASASSMHHHSVRIPGEKTTDEYSASTATPPSPTNLAPPRTEPGPDTRQYFRVIVRENATLALIPDPVTCYEHARYEQVQRIDCRCPKTSSLALLDWYTSGRTLLAQPQHNSEVNDLQKVNVSELWGFERYKSRNEIRVADHVIVRDSLLLSSDADVPPTSGERAKGTERRDRDSISTLARRNAPYGCYATLFLLGPDFQAIIEELVIAYHQVQQRVLREAPALLWSFSILREDRAGGGTGADAGANEEDNECVLKTAVLRVAAADAEAVRTWLRGALGQLQAVIGDDLYKQAFGT